LVDYYTRRALLRKIAQEECRVTDLAEPFAMSLNAVSKHLKVLEAAGLLKRSKDGRVHRCRMDAAPLAQIDKVVKHYLSFWDAHLDAIQSELDELNK